MEHAKSIALVAHDEKTHDLLEWACFNRELLKQYELSVYSERLDAAGADPSGIAAA